MKITYCDICGKLMDKTDATQTELKKSENSEMQKIIDVINPKYDGLDICFDCRFKIYNSLVDTINRLHKAQ